MTDNINNVETAIKNGKFKVISRPIIPIEDLKVGDYLSSYHFADSAVYARILKSIDKVSYSGKVLVVSVDNNIVRLTPDNDCLVRYRCRENDHCVYVMKKGKAFRVGMSKIWHEDNGCGPYKRLVEESGDESWILGIFPSRRHALLEEAKVSIRFRLPQTMFSYKEGRGSWTQEEFDDVWGEVDNYEDAKKALEYYNRDINYPYFDRSKLHTSIKRPHVVKACNILKNSEMFIRNKKWMNIDISEDTYEGDIYKLIVDKDNNYFLNNILIKN